MLRGSRPIRFTAALVGALTLAAGPGTAAAKVAAVPYRSVPSGMGLSSSVLPAQGGRAGIPAFSHIFVVVMENLGYSQALATPGFATLARHYGLATRYYGVAHPSLPNYLALTGGSTFGITSDCTSCLVNADNLASQLARARISFTAYMEGIPTPCYLAPYGGVDYAGKHDPFRYYLSVRRSRAQCSRIRPESELAAALRGPPSDLSRFVWVTPDLCHDGHDCAAATAASWLDGFVSRVVRSAAWRDGGVLFVTWDESNAGNGAVTTEGTVVSTGGGGHVATLVISPRLSSRRRVTVAYNHYSLLATIEDALGLPLLRRARTARPMAAFFSSP